ncbi:glycosyltransferase family 87 protein [Corynebacterium provencense]|uniref:glycosyltransferase family 87 protein n=1 Tax=Corynebacterium provencense TaxID=1737425 RepID=UPI000AC1B3BE|nr:glycosyltransferase family 87 protein [Corynebacterium provencense]
MTATTTTHSPAPGDPAPESGPGRFSRILTRAAWPLAVMTVLHRVIITPHNEHPTDDFTTVWSALHRFVTGTAVYVEDYTNDDPHYLYSPGGTLLLSPLGMVPSGVGRNGLILADAVAVILALALLTLLVRRRLTGPVLPVAVLVFFASETVTNTLQFSNVNGLLFFLEVVFLWMLLVDRGQAPVNLLAITGRSDRGTAAAAGAPDAPPRWAGILGGVALGLAITVKPQFVVLLFLPLVRRQWRVLASGVGVPVVITGIGWLVVPDTDNYVNVLLPYLGEVRDYANSSLAGVGAHYGWSSLPVLALQAVAALCVLTAVLGLLWWRDSDPFMWAATTTSVLLTGVFLVSSLGQLYYTMMLIPVFFTVLCRRSVMHGTFIWFGVYLTLTLDDWYSDRWPGIGEILHYSLGTVGWSILLVASAVCVARWLAERRRSGQDTGPGALLRDLLAAPRHGSAERARTDGDSPESSGTPIRQ